MAGTGDGSSADGAGAACGNRTGTGADRSRRSWGAEPADRRSQLELATDRGFHSGAGRSWDCGDAGARTESRACESDGIAAGGVSPTMSWWRRVRNLGRRERVDAEIAEELAAHMETAAEEEVRNGATEAEARRAARLRFGNPVAVREQTAGADAALGLAGVGRDMKYALRQMRRSPGFAATVILTLGLAIGANLGVFRVLYSVLLAPLPVAHPEELVALRAVQSPLDHQWFFS